MWGTHGSKDCGPLTCYVSEVADATYNGGFSIGPPHVRGKVKLLEMVVVWTHLDQPKCQKRVAYPRLPYLRRGEPMLFDVRVPLVIRPEVRLTGDKPRGLGVPREHSTRCTPHLAGYVTGSMPQ